MVTLGVMAKQKRPKDINQLAKMIMEISTGEITENNEAQGNEVKLPAPKKKKKP